VPIYLQPLLTTRYIFKQAQDTRDTVVTFQLADGTQKRSHLFECTCA